MLPCSCARFSLFFETCSYQNVFRNGRNLEKSLVFEKALNQNRIDLKERLFRLNTVTFILV